MSTKLKELKNISSPNCITISLNTHLTFPDNDKDSITLKNLIKEAENRLKAGQVKNATLLIKKMNVVAESIDHRMNIESLTLFINDDHAEFIRLPIPVTDRVTIDESFATRDLIRALHQNANYYILVLNKDNARLIEALNDRVVEEIKNESFPYTTPGLLITSSDAGKYRRLISEFYNRVDKELNRLRKENPLRVLICTDEQNYHEYLKIADDKNALYPTFFSRSRQTETPQAIVTDAWNIIKEIYSQQNNERKAELSKAVTNNRFLSDTNEINRAIEEGRIQTLFVEQGLFRPAKIENNEIIYVSENERNNPEIIDDIYDELIEKNMNYGGDVVFLPKGELDKFQGFGAITRY